MPGFNVDNPSMYVPALLEGVRRMVVAAAAGDSDTGTRPAGDGSPQAAYKGAGWYFGVYFNGAGGAWGGSQEGFAVSLSVGVDITRVVSTIPTAKRGEWFMQPGELLERSGYVVELLMRPGSGVRNSCQSAYDEMMGGTNRRNGTFQERFDKFTQSKPRPAPADWIVARNVERTPILVVSLTFSGLTFHKLRSEVPTPP